MRLASVAARRSPGGAWAARGTPIRLPHSRFIALGLVAAALTALPAAAQPSILDWSTFLGGRGIEDAIALAVAHDGGVIVAGSTNSSDLPASPTAFQTAHAARLDAFIARLSPDGRRLEFLTYYGGAGDDVIVDLVVDADGSILATGHTTSIDLPMAPTAFISRSRGGSEAFAIRLDSTGSQLLASTYLGGAGMDYAEAIRPNRFGRVLIAGEAADSFPTTPGAFSRTHRGSSDIFVARLSPDLDAADYITLLGGGNTDCRDCTMDVTPDGRAVIVAETMSRDLPTSPGAFRASSAGGADAYIAVLSADGSSLDVGTYLGGSAHECTEGCRVAVDDDGSIWIAGNTASSDFPAVPTSSVGPAGGRDMFLAHVSGDGQQLLLSRRYRAQGTDMPRDLALDPQGNVWVSLRTTSSDLPTVDAFDPVYNGGGDVAVLALERALGDVTYGTFLGGQSEEGGWLPRIALGSLGELFVAGQTASADFPTTIDAFDRTLAARDAFVLKLTVQDPPTPTPSATPTSTSTSTLTPTPTATSTSPVPTNTPAPSTLFLPIFLREECPPKDRFVDVVLVLDASTSMLATDPSGTMKLEAAKQAAATFVDSLRVRPNGDRIGVVAFNAEAFTLTDLTSNAADVAIALDTIEIRERTRLHLGIDRAAALLAAVPREAARTRAIIVLSDGMVNPDPPSLALETARQARDAEIRIYAIGYGTSVDETILRAVAGQNDRYFPAAQLQTLIEVFRDLTSAVLCDPALYWPTRRLTN